MAENKDEIMEMLHLDDDEAWEAMIANMSHGERVAYSSRFHKAASGDPERYPGPPAELLEEMKTGVDKYEESNREVATAEQNYRIAKAHRDALAEAMLLENIANKTKGH